MAGQLQLSGGRILTDSGEDLTDELAALVAQQPGLTGAFLSFTSPLATPGLLAWYRAQDLVDSGVVDGTAVFGWPDRSGNDRHLQQITTSTRRPTLQTAEANGQACLRFDATDDLLAPFDTGNAADRLFNFLHRTNAWTYIAVIKIASDVAATGFLWGTSNITSGAIGAALIYTVTTNRLRLAIQNSAIPEIILSAESSDNAVVPGTTHLVVVRVQRNRDGATNDATIEVDGVQVAAADFTANLPSVGGSTNNFNLNAAPHTAASCLKCDRFEEMFYGRRITDDELATITGALTTTYGL